LFLLLTLLFSAVPGALGLATTKSGLGSALFLAWYGLFPPVLLLLTGLRFYRRESNWLRLWGRAWLGVGLWFAVQEGAALLAAKSLIFQLLALPAVLAGGSGFAAGTVVFLAGGGVLILAGTYGWKGRPAAPFRLGRGARAAVAATFVAALLAIPVLIVWSSVPGAASQPVAGGVTQPTEDEIWSYVSDVYGFGARRTGTPEALATADYLVSRLKEFGFDDVRVETLKFDYWQPLRWQLSVDDGAGARDLEAFYVPYSGPTGPEGVAAEVVYAGSGLQQDWAGQDLRGKMVLVDLPPIDVTWDQLKIFGYLAYDPTQSAAGQSRPYPIGWMMHYLTIYPALEKAGVAGIIGVMRGYPDMGPLSYYAPYDGVLRPVPGFYIREGEGDKLKQALQGGRVTARAVLEASVAKGGGEARVVYGVLPGRSPSNVIVHSHYDSPWASGVEDSSGTGMVLALARYFADVPAESRSRTMVFLFTGSHMIGAPTNQAFIEAHRQDLMANNLFDIAIEHIADDFPYSDVETNSRGAFVSENPVVTSLFSRAVIAEGLNRTLVFPTGTPLGVPTDAGPFFDAGYQIVSLISGPVYLFDQVDTLDRVVKGDLVPMAATYIDFIGRLGRIPDLFLRFRINGLAMLLLILLSALGVVGYAARRTSEAG